jgi:hypothetical protein
LQNNSAFLKGALEDCRNHGVRNQPLGVADRLFQSARAAYLQPTGEQLAGKHSHLVDLFHDGFSGGILLRSEFRLVHLKVEALEALDASDVPRF